MITAITKKNVGNIYGKLKRFFQDSEVITYHNFDCGWENIKPYYLKEKCNVQVSLYHEIFEYKDKECIYLTPSQSVGGCYPLPIGSRISFYGDRIIFQKDWTSTSDKHYLYVVFEKINDKCQPCHSCAHYQECLLYEDDESGCKGYESEEVSE